MKILIDARMYGPRSSKGLGRYIQQIVEGLKREDHVNDYIVLLTKDNWDEFSETPRFKKVLAPWRWYTLAEQFNLPKLIKSYNPDLVHFPHFNVPLLYRGRFIVTIHDVLLRVHHSRRSSTLGLIKFWLKKCLYLWVIKSAILRAEKIIAVSNFTKNEILKYYRVAPEKIEVVLEGFTNLGQNLEQNFDDKEILLRYNITKPFLLYVGNVYPHKNLENLLYAFKELVKDWDGQLVLAGKKDYFYERLEGLAQGIGLDKEKVLFLDYVSDQDLASLYRLARLYVFPSLYEGFGLPPLEAMSQGLPTVVSDIPCLKEICGSASEYFDPKDVSSITKKIGSLLNNQPRQAELKKLGLEQIKKYNWDEAVKKHFNIYHASKK